MEYTTLGASGLQVSRPCLGPMMFGHSPDAPSIRHAWRTRGEGPNAADDA
jgi:aryl-alcohol dehydrogenase-like predicted oxidoreductase